jgi:hypothetical protein
VRDTGLTTPHCSGETIARTLLLLFFIRPSIL